MIDWTKPLELIDGTPVYSETTEPVDGFHTVLRRDGECFHRDNGYPVYCYFVLPSGVVDGGHEVTIRNANPEWPVDALYPLGAMVQKKGRAKWRGRICGWYRTDQTALGFAVESIYEPGSVQIYSPTALEPLI